MSGWISLHRKILDWEWYDDINTTRLFIHCLLKANHTPKKWKGIDIDRGQFITSFDKISSETGLSVSQVRTCLKKLKSTSEIASKSHTQHTVITIVSYDDHQGNDKRDSKPVTNESQTNRKRVTTTNNDNNEKKGIKELFDSNRIIPVWNSLGCKQHRGLTKSAEKALTKTYKEYCSNAQSPKDLNDWLESYLVNGFGGWMTTHHREMNDGKWSADLEFAVRFDTYDKIKNTVI